MHNVTFQNSSFSPHSVFTCFVRFYQSTLIISLNIVNRLVSAVETGFVVCEVGRKFYLQINICLETCKLKFLISISFLHPLYKSNSVPEAPSEI
jgi:hypothetical protein